MLMNCMHEKQKTHVDLFYLSKIVQTIFWHNTYLLLKSVQYRAVDVTDNEYALHVDKL